MRGCGKKSHFYLDRDLAIALRPLELLDSLLHDLLGQQRHRHVSSSLLLLPTLLYSIEKNFTSAQTKLTEKVINRSGKTAQIKGFDS